MSLALRSRNQSSTATRAFVAPLTPTLSPTRGEGDYGPATFALDAQTSQGDTIGRAAGPGPSPRPSRRPARAPG